MNVKKRIKLFLQIGLCTSMLIGVMLVGSEFVKAEQRVVQKTEADTRRIPDLYNTGCRGELTKITDGKLPCTIDGASAVIDGSTGTDRLVLNLKYKHKTLKGKIVFENLDLCDYGFYVYNTDALMEENREVSFIFNNCKLKNWSGGRSSVKGLSYEFNNCTMESCYGSDVVFNHCLFGGGINDRMNLFVNCYVNDCYIYNATSNYESTGEIHVDGVQIYGNNTDKTIKAENIHYDNCRFELPALKYPNAPKAYVNACIMLQTEFSDGDNMSFENCYLNGGGYAMYVHGCKGTKLSNIVFKNLKFGCARKYGWIYPDKPETDQVEWNEDTYSDADSIYVGTVSRNSIDHETWFSVTNDTNEKRYFRAYTSNGTYYDYAIDACPLGSELNERNLTFEELPFDKKYIIPEYCEWVVVYEMTSVDNSTEAKMEQVRFENWTENETVTIPSVSANNLTYKVEDGTMTVSGFGKMPEFSQESKPWGEQGTEIEKIIVEGFTSVSKEAFKEFENLKEIQLSEDVEIIEENAFTNCVSLNQISLPANLREIGKDAFSVEEGEETSVVENREIHFMGSLKQWMNIKFNSAKSNPMYVSGADLFVNNTELVENVDLKEEGVEVVKAYSFAGCRSLKELKLDLVTEIGINAFEKSAVKGEITIPDTVKKIGTYSFNGCKNIEKVNWNAGVDIPMGCFQFSDSLKEVNITTEITALRNWCFKGCKNLLKIEIPKTVNNIAQSSFQNCISLTEVNIPKGVTGFAHYVFAGCSSMQKVYFYPLICPNMTNTTWSGIPDQSVEVYIPEGSNGYEDNKEIARIAKKFVVFKGEQEELEQGKTEQENPTHKDDLNSKTEISVKGTKIQKIKKVSSRKISVSWKKRTGITGYEVQYSADKGFKKKVKTKRIKKASSTKTTLKLSGNSKRYYVRIRTYKLVNGERICSKWSKTTKVTLYKKSKNVQ